MSADGEAHRLEGDVSPEDLTLVYKPAEFRFALAALERLPQDPQLLESLRRLLRQASQTTLRPIG